MMLADSLFTLSSLGPPWVGGVLQSLFILISVLMVLVVLIQKPQGGGLAGAFGGSSAGSGQTAFGTKTGDALTLFTVGVFVIFIVLAILLNLALKAPKLNPAAAVQSTSETAPADTAPAGTTPADATTTPAPSSDTPALPATNPQPAPISPEAELPASVPTPTTPPATNPAPAPAPESPAPKPDGGM